VDTFGSTLRHVRKLRNLSLRGLSELVRYDWSYLSQIERGIRRPTAKLAAACDRALDADGRLVLEYERTAGEVNMQRRTVLRTLTALAVNAPPMIGLEALRQGMGAAVGADDLDEWQRIVVDYGRAYYQLPPEALMEQLSTDLAILQTMIAAAVGDRRAGLSSVAAHLSTMVAMGLVCEGRILLARRWWQTARRAADESGDVETRVLVRAWETVNGCYRSRPLPEILPMSDEAVRLAGDRVSAATAGLHAGRAQALALLGRTDAARAEVVRVRDITDRLPAAVKDDVESLWGWPEHRLRHTESYVCTYLGDLTAADVAQNRAMTLYPVSQARLRTQVQLHQASCLVQQGHVSEGIRHASTLLDQLPATQHNRLLHEVARQILTVVPDKERHRPAVAELVARLPTSDPV
jgi:transcriptional regulator with XRE-family HTH domain